MPKAPRSFDFYVADFVDGVRLMDADEVGAYILLLCEQWKRGHIPESDKERQRAAQVFDTDQWERIWRNIKTKFGFVETEKLVDSNPSEKNRHVFANQRMHEDRQEQYPKYNARREIARKNGSKGGRPPKPRRNPDRNPAGFSEKPRSEGGRGKGEVINSKEKGVTIEVETLQGTTKELSIPDGVATHLGQEVLALYQTWVNVRTSNHQVNLDGPQNLLILQSLSEVPRNKRVELLTKAAMNGWKTLDNGAAEKITNQSRRPTLKI